MVVKPLSCIHNNVSDKKSQVKNTIYLFSPTPPLWHWELKERKTNEKGKGKLLFRG